MLQTRVERDRRTGRTALFASPIEVAAAVPSLAVAAVVALLHSPPQLSTAIRSRTVRRPPPLQRPLRNGVGCSTPTGRSGRCRDAEQHAADCIAVVCVVVWW